MFKGNSKTPKLFTSVSTEDCPDHHSGGGVGGSGDGKINNLSKQPKQRWSSFPWIKVNYAYISHLIKFIFFLSPFK